MLEHIQSQCDLEHNITDYRAWNICQMLLEREILPGEALELCSEARAESQSAGTSCATLDQLCAYLETL